MPKESYTVPVRGHMLKVYAASLTQARMAAELLEKNPPPDLSEEAQRARMQEALEEARRRDKERVR